MNKLVKAVFTLTSFSMLDRALGFVFKIYLSREMGASALGVYQVALSFFFVLMTLVTSGLPLIAGKMTAEYEARGLKRTNALTTAGLLLNGVISITLIGLVFALRVPLTSVIGNEESANLLYVLLPGLLFCAIAAALRGSFWGKERYAAISIIELLEQVARIGLCVLFFALGFVKTFAATLSLTIAVGFSMVLTAVLYAVKGGRLASPAKELKPLFSSSAPISVLRASTSLVNSLLAVVIPFLFTTSGMTNEEALAMYGATVGMAMPLVFLPITVIGSLSQAMIPTLAKASAVGNHKEVKRQAERAIDFSVVVASLFIPMFAGIGAECGELLYGNADAGRFLQMGGLLLIPVALESITSSMMNSLGMEKQGFVNYVIGSAVMFGVAFCFYGHFSAEAFCLSQAVSLILSTSLDVICIKKRTGISLSFLKTTGVCLLLAVPCIFLTNWIFNLLFALPQLLALILSALVGVGGMAMLGVAFGFIDVGRFNSRKKSSANLQKRLHISS